MKLIIALLAAIPGLLVAEQLTTLQQHKALFSVLTTYESLVARATTNAKTAESLQKPAYVSVPPKSEFETTAAYNSRLSAASTKAEMERLAALAENRKKGIEIAAKIPVAAEALRKTQEELDSLTTRIIVTMGAYDADTQTVVSMTPGNISFGSGDDNRLALVQAPLKAQPSFKCPIDTARRLRACSDKGELFCTIRFVRPKIKLSQESITLPATTGEKFTQGAGILALAMIVSAIHPDSLKSIDTNIADNKVHGANIIRIVGWASYSYVNLHDKSGNPIVEFQ